MWREVIPLNLWPDVCWYGGNSELSLAADRYPALCFPTSPLFVSVPTLLSLCLSPAQQSQQSPTMYC